MTDHDLRAPVEEEIVRLRKMLDEIVQLRKHNQRLREAINTLLVECPVLPRRVVDYVQHVLEDTGD
jgi:hypothetical protein